MYRSAVQDEPSHPPYPYQRLSCLQIAGVSMTTVSTKAFPQETASVPRAVLGKKTRPDRRRWLRRYCGSAGTKTNRCRNHADRPAQSPYLSATPVSGRHRCFVALRDSGADPAARGETEEPQGIAGGG